MSKSVHRRHRAGRRFRPNSYDPEKARQSIRDAITDGEREYPYRWHWRVRPEGRKDQRLRVICRGSMNSALVEFADGYCAVVSRNGLRRVCS